MDQIKDAFQKVKNDISLLKDGFELLKNEVSFIRNSLNDILNLIRNMKNIQNPTPTDQQIIPTHNPAHPTIQHIIQHINSPFSPLKDENKHFSTGNDGVPTDRQTDQQTDRQTDRQTLKNQFSEEKENFIDSAANLFDSLDSVKKEIRLKFKKLTEQEIAVFSAIYQLDEELGQSDYKSLSKKLNLTESSIRDYVGKLIKKKIPVEKTRINNKQIVLTISQNLKKIAPLSTIIKLREL